MARALKVKRYELTNVNFDYLGAFRLRLEAYDPVNMDANVFLYRRGPVDPYTGEAPDTFFAVAGPVDLEEYPVGAPDADTPYPFFRLDYVELDFRATSQAEDTYEVIIRELGQLIEILDRLELLEPTAVVQLGDPGADSESASVSASESESESASESV